MPARSPTDDRAGEVSIQVGIDRSRDMAIQVLPLPEIGFRERETAIEERPIRAMIILCQGSDGDQVCVGHGPILLALPKKDACWLEWKYRERETRRIG
jgi:hypothetical protein